MIVEVSLYATLRRRTPAGYQSKLSVELFNGASVADLLKTLEITLPIEQVMVVINLRRVDGSYSLSDGDNIKIFPPISGG